ncbi:MAG: ribonuclease E/G [Verrucomicrobia bacterium]|nr:ribonuclease E/G [Verrucomicrobiota bacterium]
MSPMKINSKQCNSLLVSKDSSFLKIASLKNGKIWQFFYQPFTKYKPSQDDIYSGKVIRVTPQFIWVDIGEKNLGVLKRKLKEKPLIEGQRIIVQISKEEISDIVSHKGSRLTQNIYIPGKFCIYHPFNKNIFFSKNLSTITKQKLSAFLGKEISFTLRTSSESLMDISDLQKEMNHLRESWKFISQTPQLRTGLIKSAPTPLERLLRDTDSTTEVIFDDAGILASSKKHVTETDLGATNNWRLASLKEQPLFEFFGIQDDWEMLTEPLVPLSTGGNLYIEETASAIIIDVNAGEKSPEEINFEAVSPIIQQIRLRQLSGNILIDFVRISPSSRKKLLIDFENHLKNENTQGVKILGWSHLGFLELQAPKHHDSLTKQLNQKSTPKN